MTKMIALLAGAACLAAASVAWTKEFPAVPAEVSLLEGENGTYTFQNDFGKSFYIYDKDEKGKSHCLDACTESWAPVKARDFAKPMGDWTLVQRPEGYYQWAYKGKPIYSSITEVVHGAVTLPKEWHVLTP
jgi:predicted lipoprotein with Yx(FWY)xxD motif